MLTPQNGYKDTNLLDILSSNTVKLIYNRSDIPTFLHYNGSTTNPTLTILSADISSEAIKEIVDVPGHDHRIIITTTNGHK